MSLSRKSRRLWVLALCALGIGTASAIVDADQFQSFEDQILRAAGVTLEQRRLVREPGLLFDGVRSDAGQGERGKQGNDEFVTRHGAGI